MATPISKSRVPRWRSAESFELSENVDPNLLPSPPHRWQTATPVAKPAKSNNFSLKTPSPSPAKDKISASLQKSSSKCHKGLAGARDKVKDMDLSEGCGRLVVEEIGDKDLEGSAKMRRMRRVMLEEAMSGVPEQGAGRVMYLVKTFERLLSIPKETTEGESGGEVERKVMNWALPGLQRPCKAEVSEDYYTSPISFSQDLGSDSAEESSTNSKDNRLSCGCSHNDSDGGQMNRQNSTGSSGRSWNKKLKVTSLRPFKLRTEDLRHIHVKTNHVYQNLLAIIIELVYYQPIFQQRGKFKEEQFIKKVKEILLEEEMKHIPIAQGLPWTTDEPECLIKPPIKEPTEPIDLMLHSDVRAVERAEFDLHVAERMSFIEQIKLERERQQKLEEEEEIRRLRRELVPKAQPMPYFDRLFIPKRSTKPRTVPKEPRFHIR